MNAHLLLRAAHTHTDPWNRKKAKKGVGGGGERIDSGSPFAPPQSPHPHIYIYIYKSALPVLSLLPYAI